MVGLPSLVLPSLLKPFLKHPKMCLNSDKVDNEDKPLLEHLRLGSFIVDILCQEGLVFNTVPK